MTREHGSRQKKRMGPVGALSALELKVATVVTVVRRLGHVLMKAHEVAEKDLIAHGFQATAEELRNGIKPLYDAMLHFEAGTQVELVLDDVSRETEHDDVTS